MSKRPRHVTRQRNREFHLCVLQGESGRGLDETPLREAIHPDLIVLPGARDHARGPKPPAPRLPGGQAA